jgi:MoxR-like ATPase
MADIQIQKIIDHMNQIFLGQDAVVKYIVAALLARGHILLEGVPGVGKTLIGLSISRLLNLSFKRVQFTNDLLPSDITGFHTIRGSSGEFSLVKGPIFASIVLADEINRTSPKTQSALLEAMEERTVTIDGTTYDLPLPFMVIATQNPVEVAGTFPLPESQMDRFLFRVRVEYPPLEEEMQILARGIDHTDALRLEPIISRETILAMINGISQVTVHKDILHYMITLIRSARAHPRVELGPSPRGGLALKRASQAWAFMHGRNYATPGDVKTVAPLVLTHRIMSKDGDPRGILESLIHETQIPV